MGPRSLFELACVKVGLSSRPGYTSPAMTQQNQVRTASISNVRMNHSHMGIKRRRWIERVQVGMEREWSCRASTGLCVLAVGEELGIALIICPILHIRGEPATCTGVEVGSSTCA